jgi:hypothetical protein
MALSPIDPDLLAVIEKARAACQSGGEPERPPEKRGFDLSGSSPEDKRRLYAMALAGKLGSEWQRHAQRRPIGIWLLDYEWLRRPPSADKFGGSLAEGSPEDDQDDDKNDRE